MSTIISLAKREIEDRYPWLYKRGIVRCKEIDEDRVLIVLGNGAEYIYDIASSTERLKEVFYIEDMEELEECQWVDAFRYLLERQIDICGITVEELADRVGISAPMLSKYMKGSKSIPAWIMYKIAYELDCTMDDLCIKEYIPYV